MTNDAFIDRLRNIVGRKHCLTDPSQTERFRKGWRSGEGNAIAVLRPGSLVEMWRCLLACVDADKIVILQAANTGLTEGSTPKGSYDREVVVISTLRLDGIHLIRDGRQIVGLPGSTLYKLEALLDPLGREPHSVIGSSCVGASIIGGICNNSGGALVRRGPAYTELSLHARVTEEGELQLINNLGIDLGNDPEDMLARLERGDFGAIHDNTGRASDDDYAKRVRDVQADTPGRFNADPRGLYESSGSAGKLAVFAVRLDTFPTAQGAKTYYIGTDDTAKLTALRRGLLGELDALPISGEYVHRDCFEISRKYGKDTLLMIHWLGTARMPRLFGIKEALDARLHKIGLLPGNLLDRIMQGLSRLFPEALPGRLLDYRDRFEHHLILKVGGAEADATEAILDWTIGSDGWFPCDADEAAKATLNRFAAAGAAARYQVMLGKRAGDLLPLDIALRRNDDGWFETLPPDLDDQIAAKIYYGHFLCHVLHQDYVLKAGTDTQGVKSRMLDLLDKRGAEYPAEHNVGHLYKAKPALCDHYRACDPTNSLNPGIGKTSRRKNWA